MGDKAEDVLYSFVMTRADSKMYAKKSRIDLIHILSNRKVIFERARFNQRKQEEGEPVEPFLASLYKFSEHCNYGTMLDEMIRDWLVMGLQDASLSQKLQLEADLTLDQAIATAKQTEAVKNQQA